MKKTGALLLAALLTACLTLTGIVSAGEGEEKAKEEEKKATVLVAVFSCTGTTKSVAEKIVALEEADLYEILPQEPYSSEDINYNDDDCRANQEQRDPLVRPAIQGEELDLEGYERIYVGFPIWWGEEPRIMDTFVESYDFDGITMIPFCTSGSSPIGQSGENLEEKAGSGTWLEGKRFSGSTTEEELQSWIEDLEGEAVVE